MITRILFTLLVLGTMLFAHTANAQKRDHLTPQEVDLVKEAQALDKRIDVFIKAADRRLLVINGGGGATADAKLAKQLKKDAEKWGELPTGTRAELVTDIARILDEAITNIDDVSARDERNPLIPKALRKLAQSVNTMMEQLKPLRGQAKTDSEIASFESLNEGAQSILDAVVKLPPEVEKKAKAKNK
jgi:acyl-CoA reductase-like NAD-dependent aldehyde dehydrogenase